MNSPMLLSPTMQFRNRSDLYFSGQITGIEGYVGNIATGMVAAVNLARSLNGLSEWILPRTSMLGALCYYVSHAEPQRFQPMKANFGIMPELPLKVKNKRDRYAAYANRALQDVATSIIALNDPIMQPIPLES
jgi:methylenetetrahydrofolate--tRNA-(uracil-5-)-methyltransferase